MAFRHRLASCAFNVAVMTACGAVVADENLAGIACRSVHLRYPAPEASAFYNEVAVEKSAAGTYFCACGFNQGYFGIQELGGGKKVVIFSVWDPGAQNDPNAVDPKNRVRLVSKDEQVRIGRFGNEGTGGQSFLDLDWKPGETYRFLVQAKLDGDRTVYSASIAPPGAKAWRRLASFSTLAQRRLLSGYYSFIEDFKRDKVSATIERRATFGAGWVRTKDGTWRSLRQAEFTADANPALNIDAGMRGDRFFLDTGGKVKNTHTPLHKLIDLAPASQSSDARPEPLPDLLKLD
ncbi:MAG: DUF3472 domain-containing protein [Planctomycetota bacterium]|nr:DUF3472 domain-containing protein [Planctomycetota bacterium]